MPLIDALRAHGAALDSATPGALDAPLSNHAPRAAEAMIALGAPRDSCAAAALGDLARVQAAFDERGRLRERIWRRGRELPPREAVGLALLFAYVNRQQPHVVDVLLERDGVERDRRGLRHRAAPRRVVGTSAMAQRLIARGAILSNRYNPFTATAFGWAIDSRQTAVADWLRAKGLVDLHDAVATI